MKKLTSFALAALLTVTGVVPAFADSSADMMSMLEGMKRQMTDLQRTIDQQNLRIQQLESHKVLETAHPSMPVPAPAAQPATMSDPDFQKSLKDNLGEAFPWLKGAKYGGDLRLRAENFDTFDKNNDAGSTGTSSDRSRNRFRIRLRWGFEKDYGDDWKAGFRLATGSTTDQTSTNQTLGNAGYFNFKTLTVERAYASYSPAALKGRGPLKGVTVGAGKFENPFLRYSTPIVWDGDVTPEGIYEKATFELIDTEDAKLNLYGTLGQFILNENAGVSTDAEMYGYQGALNLSTYGFGTELPVDLTGAVSFYDYPGWFQTVTNNTASTSYLRTNTLVADNFRVLDIYPELQFYVKRTPVVIWYDYAVNLANVGTDDLAQSLGNDIHDKDNAWGFGVKLGRAKKKGDWEAFWGYYSIGANAVVAAFNDSDFGGPGTAGYTNRLGQKFGLGYQLTDNVMFNWTGYVVRPLDAGTSVANSSNETVFRSQADLVYKF